MDTTLRLVGAARSSDFTRTAADRRRGTVLDRCRRRVLGIFPVEQPCTPCPTA